MQGFKTYKPPSPGGGGLRISGDGDDRRIFKGMQFSIPGFFWEGIFGKNFHGLACVK